MLKKNQLVLILLTLVLMLSVYFIRSPFKDKENDNQTGDEVQNVNSGRLDELKELRTILNDERSEQVLSLDAIIADGTKTVEEIDMALKEKRYINSLTEKELLLEVQIIKKGYQDCFVHASNNGIEITVVSEDSSKKKANEIISMALSKFEGNLNNVSIDFQTVEEVMGKVE